MFSTNIKVRFNHVDAAGIVFYPRYYEMFNQVVEEWCENKLGFDFHELNMVFNAGLPAANIQAEFPNPSYLGDLLRFELVVEKVGTSSVTLTISGQSNEQQRVFARMVLVYISKAKDGNSFAASPIPEKIKSLMQAG